MTNNNERAVVPRGQEDNNTRDIVTIEQHQERLNWEIVNLENGRSGGQAWEMWQPDTALYTVQYQTAKYSIDMILYSGVNQTFI